MTPETYLTPKDVGERLQLSERTARDLLVRSKLCAFVRVGRAIRVNPATLEDWLAHRESDSKCSPGVRRLR